MAEQAQTRQEPLWRVTGQREANRQDEQGRYVAGVLVTFQTRTGTVGSVWLPNTQYSAENVRNVVNTRVAVLEGVSALTG